MVSQIGSLGYRDCRMGGRKRWCKYLEAIFVGRDGGGAWAGAERWPLRDWGMGEAAVEERCY